jgi:hypothetical protein
MEYLTRDELVRLFRVARNLNPLHHVALLVGLLHGLRVSEMLKVRGRDICDGKLAIKRLQKSRATLHAGSWSPAQARSGNCNSGVSVNIMAEAFVRLQR